MSIDYLKGRKDKLPKELASIVNDLQVLHDQTVLQEQILRRLLGEMGILLERLGACIQQTMLISPILDDIQGKDNDA
jgi:hypothetical protein